MFGKPAWFRKKKVGWGLVPTSWQGWIYALVWSAVIAVPFLLLVLVRHQYPEAGIWMVAAIGFLVWDVRKIMLEMEREERKGLLYIGEDEAKSDVATRNFDLHVRD